MFRMNDFLLGNAINVGFKFALLQILWFFCFFLRAWRDSFFFLIRPLMNFYSVIYIFKTSLTSGSVIYCLQTVIFIFSTFWDRLNWYLALLSYMYMEHIDYVKPMELSIDEVEVSVYIPFKFISILIKERNFSINKNRTRKGREEFGNFFRQSTVELWKHNQAW